MRFDAVISRVSWLSRRLLPAVVLSLAVWAALGVSPPSGAAARAVAPTLPAQLTDLQFWQLSADMSEPAGYFRSENLVSNEHTFQYVVPALQRQVKPGGVYLGVAPDQNFTYILATDPRMAFIVDIRRGNLLEHLLYKAVTELSADRAEFISRLFSKARPSGVGPASSVTELFLAYDRMPTSEDLYRENLRAVRRQLIERHHFKLSDEDLDQLESIYFAFFWEGPSLRYSMNGGFGRGFSTFPTYEELAMQTDWNGVARSYLATEENFKRLKRLQSRNLIVPVVGNFAGPKAIRAVGRYVREHGATISAFYVSNVEQYLFQDGLFDQFAQNVAALPVDGSSTFIRSVSSRFGYQGSYLGPDGRASALDPIQAFVRDVAAGRVRSYFDVNARSK
jgi:hypothetical protein